LIAILYSTSIKACRADSKAGGFTNYNAAGSFISGSNTPDHLLKGLFLAVQPNKPLHLITTKDMAAHVMKHRSQYVM